MSDTIGSWAVKLNADSSGLVQGLQSAQGSLGNFTSAAGTLVKGFTTQMNSMFAQITGSNVAQRLQPLIDMGRALVSFATSAATGNVAGMAAAFIAGGTSLTMFATAGMTAIATQERLGNRIGITAQEVAGLQMIAGRARIAPEDMGEMMRVWPMRLAELRHELDHGGGRMVGALQQMGIDAQAFASASLPEQFARLAEGSQGIGNEMQRSALMADVLSRRGMGLAPIFAQSADEIRNLSGVAQQMGYDISASDSRMIAGVVRDGRLLAQQFDATLSNLMQGAAVALAPFLSVVVETFRQLLVEGRPLIQFLGATLAAGVAVFASGWLVAMGVIRTAMPVISATGVFLDSLRHSLAEAYVAVRPLAVEIGGMVARLLNFDGTIEGLAAKIREWSKSTIDVVREAVTFIVREIGRAAGMFATAAETISRGTILFGVAGAVLNSNADLRGFAERMREVQQATNATIVSLQNMQAASQTVGLTDAQWARRFAEIDRQVYGDRQNSHAGWTQMAQDIERAAAEMGMSREAREMLQLQRDLNDEVTREQERRLEIAQELRRQAEFVRDMGREADRQRDQLRNPMEQFQSAQLRAQELFAVTGDEDLFGRQMMNAAQQLERSVHSAVQAPSAVLAGSVEAQRAIAAAQRQDREDSRDPIDRLRSVMERAERQAARQTELQQQMVQALRDGRLDIIGAD
jgi:hypothetical protein